MNPETPVNSDQVPNSAQQAAPATPAPEVINPIPTEWPKGTFGLYKYSKAAVKPNVWTLVGLYVIIAVVNVSLQAVLKRPEKTIASIVSLVFELAIVHVLFAGIRGQRMSIGQSFSKLSPMLFLKYLVNNIVVNLLLAVSFLLFVVPFFFVLPRLILAPFMLVDKNLGPIEAIGASWRLTKGHVGKIYTIIAAFIAMALLCITIIGIPFAIYFLIMYSATLPIAYLYFERQQPAEASATPATSEENPVAPNQDVSAASQGADVPAQPTDGNDAPTNPTPPTPAA
jgi:hypothetical protein